MAGDQLLDEIWYDTDSVFYMVVAMLTFTSIIGTLLYYKDQRLGIFLFQHSLQKRNIEGTVDGASAIKISRTRNQCL